MELLGLALRLRTSSRTLRRLDNKIVGRVRLQILEPNAVVIVAIPEWLGFFMPALR